MTKSDPDVDSYHKLPRVMHFHRALGGYVEAYSQGLAAMREGIECFLTQRAVPNGRSHRLLPILFAGMTAKPLADAFFGMATAAAELDADELIVRNVLRGDWEHHTAFRNDLAHAEWQVGWEYADSGEPAPPASIRIKNVGGVPTLTDMGIDTNGIIAEINLLIPLVAKVRAFADACRDKQVGRADSIMGAFRVIDPVGSERRRVTLSSWSDRRWEGR